MNLIQLSEQLKDVPDNFLMQEVQRPTGAYPAYLVVSELTRRKRIRSSAAAQQPPTTSVAEDVAQPQAQPVAQPVSQPPAGLNSLPEAEESSAGRDVAQLGAAEEEEPVQMAGGGLVAFKRGGGVDKYFPQGGVYDEMSYPDDPRQPQPLLYGEPQARAAGDRLAAMREMTAEEEDAARTGGSTRYAEANPFRSEYLKDRIERGEADIGDRRKSNTNFALMEAGLGMMGSRSPYAMQGVAEGGLRGLQSYRSGDKDIRQDERYLDAQRGQYAQAQSAYDLAKYGAGERGLEQARAREAAEVARTSAQLQGIGAIRGIQKDSQLFPLQLEDAQLGTRLKRETIPYAIENASLQPNLTRAQIAELRGKAAYYGTKGQGDGIKFATVGEIDTAGKLAEEELQKVRKMGPSDPGYWAERRQLAQRILLAQRKYFDAQAFDAVIGDGKRPPTGGASAPTAAGYTPGRGTQSNFENYFR